ncbi:hypothetical protein [Marinisporobacter balticus]|uniref:Uncharacterized protein n=1 Tax=Marinisporobacter balticus TaxID=2018667 RepID=A0A4R2L2E0_9FIRM|nr:hypothetical protein [Marinisporobacter balticus]TCO79812.1 hypothetical protein EV214_10142 [Marinisporobacter balticus]
MLKKAIIILMCLSFTCITAFAGDIPEGIMSGNQKALFIGKLTNKNSEIYTITPLTIMMGSIKQKEIKVSKFEKYYGTSDIPKNGDVLVAVLLEEGKIDNLWIFKATSSDYKTLKLKSEKHNMVKRYEKYINKGKYFEAQKRINEKTKEQIATEYIIDKGIDDYMKEVHPVSNLEKYQVYRMKDEMNIDYYFNKNVERSDIANSKNVTTELLIWKRGMVIHGPYPSKLYSLDDWDKVNYRVYIGDRKIIEQNIDKKKSLILKKEYFEDTDIELPSRIINTPETKTFEKKLKREYWWSMKDVVFEKSFKGNVLFVKLKTKRKYKEHEIQDIKKLIEEDLAVNLEQASMKIYGMNMDYLGIVLQLYEKNSKYYEETYHNGENKKYWFSEYWGNYKYFDYSEK